MYIIKDSEKLEWLLLEKLLKSDKKEISISIEQLAYEFPGIVEKINNSPIPTES